METIYVSEPKFREMDRKYSGYSIMEKGICQTVILNNREYVITGAMGGGKGKDWQCIWGYQIVNRSLYKGELEPLLYSPHWQEVDEGKRKREYSGMLVKAGNREMVITGPKLTFIKIEVGQQLTVF